jgi:hypothetical protein
MENKIKHNIIFFINILTNNNYFYKITRHFQQLCQKNNQFKNSLNITQEGFLRVSLILFSQANTFKNPLEIHKDDISLK